MADEKQQDKSKEQDEPKETGHGGLLMFERSAVDA